MEPDGLIARLRRPVSGTDLKERPFAAALFCLLQDMPQQQSRPTLAAEIRMRTDLFDLEIIDHESGENERAGRPIAGAPKQEIERSVVAEFGSKIFFRPGTFLAKRRQGKQFRFLRTRRRNDNELSGKG